MQDYKATKNGLGQKHKGNGKEIFYTTCDKSSVLFERNKCWNQCGY